MGQDVVIRLIEKFRFTTFQELCDEIDESDMGEQSITKSLCKLNNSGEVITFKISRQTIYLSPEFYETIGIVQ